jgi:hypothetical protein
MRVKLQTLLLGIKMLLGSRFAATDACAHAIASQRACLPLLPALLVLLPALLLLFLRHLLLEVVVAVLLLPLPLRHLLLVLLLPLLPLHQLPVLVRVPLVGHLRHPQF